MKIFEKNKKLQTSIKLNNICNKISIKNVYCIVYETKVYFKKK